MDIDSVPDPPPVYRGGGGQRGLRAARGVRGERGGHGGEPAVSAAGKPPQIDMDLRLEFRLVQIVWEEVSTFNSCIRLQHEASDILASLFDTVTASGHGASPAPAHLDRVFWH